MLRDSRQREEAGILRKKIKVLEEAVERSFRKNNWIFLSRNSIYRFLMIFYLITNQCGCMQGRLLN